MFGKSKVSQSMIDAVNKVLGEQPVEVVEHKQEQLLSESTPIKEPTPTGMRVFGRSYGNSAKAKQDQTKKDIDNLKGPKAKEMKEELKGNQDKIDANHNGKIDGQDFKILRGKKKVKEGREFTEKLLETVRKSDVPAYLRKAKGDTPLTVADAKGPKKDTISAPENLAKARNEEVKHIEEDVSDAIEKQSKDNLTKSMKAMGKNDRQIKYFHKKTDDVIKKAAGEKVKKEDVSEYELDEMINEVLSKDASAGDWIHDFVHSDNPKFAGKSKAERKKMALGAYYGKQNEEADATTDTLCGRHDGSDENSFTHFKKKIKGDIQPDPDDNNHAQETSARNTIKAKPTDNLALQKVKNQDAKYGIGKSFQEATIAGTSGWEKVEKNVKDKSGAVHSPMSRAKDLARQAFKNIQNKTKVK
jgi:hypothetical protein